MNFYRDLPKSKNDEIKCSFLFNLPAMNRLVDKNIYSSFKSTFIELAKHKNERVRFYWVSILEDLIEFIPEEDKTGPIRQAIEYFFDQETNPEVLEALLSKLNVVFKNFYAAEEDALNKAVSPVKLSTKVASAVNQQKEREKKLRFMGACKLLLPKVRALFKWRLIKMFVNKLDEVTKNEYMSSFYPDIQELLIEAVKKTNAEVRTDTVRLYCRIIVNLPKFEQRKNSIKLFVEEFNKDGSNENRLHMLAFFAESLKVFSRPALRYYILPLLLVYHQHPLSIKLALAKLVPDINDAVEPTDEVMLKKFIAMKNALEGFDNKHLNELLMAAINKMQLRSRLKQHQVEVVNVYKQNRSLEESYLMMQYDEASLEDVYKRESGQFVSKYASNKPGGLKPVSKPFGIGMKKPSDPKEITEKEDTSKLLPKTVSSGLTSNSKRYHQMTQHWNIRSVFSYFESNSFRYCHW